jgi:hypothetical protein
VRKGIKSLPILFGALTLLSGCSFFARGPNDYRAAVRKVLDTRNAQIESCYRQALASDPAAAGKVVVKFDVEPKTGNFAKPSVVEQETSANDAVKNCVVTSLDGLALAPPDQRKGEATFAWEFTK